MKIGMKGRLLVTPKSKRIEPFEIPESKDDETWFCTREYMGDLIYFIGKTQESASRSFNADIITVLQSHTEEYD